MPICDVCAYAQEMGREAAERQTELAERERDRERIAKERARGKDRDAA